MVALSCSSLARMAPSIMRVMSFIFSCDRSVDLENCSATDAMELASEGLPNQPVRSFRDAPDAAESADDGVFAFAFALAPLDRADPALDAGDTSSAMADTVRGLEGVMAAAVGRAAAGEGVAGARTGVRPGARSAIAASSLISGPPPLAFIAGVSARGSAARVASSPARIRTSLTKALASDGESATRNTVRQGVPSSR